MNDKQHAIILTLCAEHAELGNLYRTELLAGNHHRAIEASIKLSDVTNRLNLSSALANLSKSYPSLGCPEIKPTTTKLPSSRWTEFLDKRKKQETPDVR